MISLPVWQDPFSLPVFWLSCVAFVYGYAMFVYGYAMLLSKEYSLKQRLCKTETINFSFSSVFRLSFEWKQTQNRPCRKQHNVIHRLFKSSVSTLHERESGETSATHPEKWTVSSKQTRGRHTILSLCSKFTVKRTLRSPQSLHHGHSKTRTRLTPKRGSGSLAWNKKRIHSKRGLTSIQNGN